MHAHKIPIVKVFLKAQIQPNLKTFSTHWNQATSWNSLHNVI